MWRKEAEYLMAIKCISLEIKKKMITPEKMYLYFALRVAFCQFVARECGESRHQFQTVVPRRLRFLLSDHWSDDHQREGAAADRAPVVPVSGGSTDFHHQERDYRGGAGGKGKGQDPNSGHGQQSRTKLVITH